MTGFVIATFNHRICNKWSEKFHQETAIKQYTVLLNDIKLAV